MSDSTATAPSTLPASAAGLAPEHAAPPRRFADLGSRGAWARDFAILGALSTGLGLVAMGFVGFMPGLILVGAALGALSGLGLGWWLQPILTRDGDRLPGALIVLFGPVLGGFWGAAVGAASVLLVLPVGEGIGLGLIVGALSGVAQLTWFWLVYLGLRLRRAPAWPALVLAAVTPFIGGVLLHLGRRPLDLNW